MYKKITKEEYEKIGKKIFTGFGFDERDSSIITDVLMQADLFGIESHGISRISKYDKLIGNGIVDIHAEPEILHETQISALVDAKSAMGQPVSYRSMELAIDKAKKHGIGMVQVRNSNHYGIAGYYALMAAREGLIGVSMTNTVAIMVPTFSAEALLGSNPIAVAVPSDGDPFLYDGSTTVITRGKLELYKKLDKKIEHEWTIDGEGNVLNEPSRALECISGKEGGGILPIGGAGEENSGYKGYGFAMICEIMTSILSGGVTSVHKTDRGDTSHCFYAIDPGLFGKKEEIRKSLSELINDIHNAKKANGCEHIFVPGEKEFRRERERKKVGIPIHEKTINELEHRL